jgi:phage protein
MNKQELIDHCKTLKEDKNRFINCIDVDRIIDAIKQLDEPQPVKVPQFVAEYIEFKKKNNFHVYGAMRVIEDHYDKKVPDWFYEGNIEKFCLAWLLGYEVEEEKRYEVILCNGQSLKTVYRQGSDHLDFEMVYGDLESFTRKQLQEANFGWVFSCEGIEMVEV